MIQETNNNKEGQVLSDFTTEVLVRQHKINPRGLAVYVDELIGTIQPGLLYEFAKGKTESGFVDRWLFAYPDDSAYPKMNQEQLPKEITRNWGEVIDRIFKLPHETGTKHFRLTKDAMAVYAQWYNALADQKNASSSTSAITTWAAPRRPGRNSTSTKVGRELPTQFR